MNIQDFWIDDRDYNDLLDMVVLTYLIYVQAEGICFVLSEFCFATPSDCYTPAYK